MTSGRPMNRLCQGDVGSGKTMVAAACVWFAAQSGWQSALMAPTEILARAALRESGPAVGPLRPAAAPCSPAPPPPGSAAPFWPAWPSGDIDLCIGTHALLTADVQYARLGLVITDEQHRFGVDQRAALAAKGDRPHTLVHVRHPHSPDAGPDHLRRSGCVRHRRAAPGTADRWRPSPWARTTGRGSTPLSASRWQEGHQVFIVCPLVGRG